jgi:uncharacterized protein (TIGR02266 family)
VRILPLKCASGQELLDLFDEADGIFRLTTRTPVQVGEEVLLEASFPELPHRELLRATVRAVGLANHRVTLQVAEEDAAARDHLLAAARGDQAPGAIQRHHARFPVDVPVDWSTTQSDQRYVSAIEDLGAGGAFVRTTSPAPPGTEVALVIWDGSEDSMAIPGEVVWVRDRNGAEGMGIRFVRSTAGDARRLREMLRRMDEQGKVDLPATGKKLGRR